MCGRGRWDRSGKEDSEESGSDIETLQIGFICLERASAYSKLFCTKRLTDRPEIEEMQISALIFREQFERFQEAVRLNYKEAFRSFRDGLPKEWEGYKEDVYTEGRRRLAWSTWNGIGYACFFRRLRLSASETFFGSILNISAIARSGVNA